MEKKVMILIIDVEIDRKPSNINKTAYAPKSITLINDHTNILFFTFINFIFILMSHFIS